MLKRTVKWILGILSLAILVQSAIPPVAAAPSSDAGAAAEAAIVSQVQSLVPLSIEMVDNAIAVLGKGWAGMTSSEQGLFNQLYDPGDTGEVDQKFVNDVIDNYRAIRDRLNSSLAVVYKPGSDRCEGKRLYYTDIVKIYVCPYYNEEDSRVRKARVLIHEAVHMALLVVDRPYFHKNTYSTRYEALTPRGSWTAGIPLLGPIFREIAHGDTLYHPDAYAWLSVELSALSRNLSMVSESRLAACNKVLISPSSKGSMTVRFGFGGSIARAMFSPANPSSTAHSQNEDKVACTFRLDFGPRTFCSRYMGFLLFSGWVWSLSRKPLRS